MGQENVELARKAFDAIGRRDWDGLLALMDQEVESVSRTTAIEGGLHGHEGIRRWWGCGSHGDPRSRSRGGQQSAAHGQVLARNQVA